MAIAVVRSAQTAGSAATASLSITTPTAGNVLVAFFSQLTNANTPTLSGWTIHATNARYNATTASLWVAYKVAAGTETSIAVTAGTSGTIEGICYWELSGASNPVNLDVTPVAVNNLSAATGSVTVATPTQGSIVLIGVGANASSGTISAWTGTNVATNISTAAARTFGGSFITTSRVNSAFTANWATSHVAAMLAIAIKPPPAFGDFINNGITADAASASSFTLTFPNTTVSGDSIIVAARVVGDIVVSASDNKGNTYNLDRVHFQTVDGHKIAILRASNITGGASHTVTLTLGTASAVRWAIDEYFGNFVLHGTPVSAQGNSGSPSSGNQTTTSTAAIIGVITSAGDVNNNTFTAGSGYVARRTVSTASHLKLQTEDKSGTVAAGTYAADGTIGGSTENWAAALVAYTDGGAATNASVTQVAATVTAAGGTQSIDTVNNVALSQVAGVVTAAGGTQTTTITVTQAAGAATATGGTQVVTSTQLVNISQLAGTVTASGGTQTIATVNNVSIAQVAGAVTCNGGTQVIATVNNVAISQLAATVTAGGGTQTVATVNNVAIAQVAANVTASGGTQAVTTGSVVNASVTQVAGIVTASGGTQAISTVNNVSISQVAGSVTANGGIQTLASQIDAAIAQLAANVTATGGTQTISAGNSISIAQTAATITVTGNIQTVTAGGVVSATIAQVAGTVTVGGGSQVIGNGDQTAVATPAPSNDMVIISYKKSWAQRSLREQPWPNPMPQELERRMYPETKIFR